MNRKMMLAWVMFLTMGGQAQDMVKDPVHFICSVNKTGDKTCEVRFAATMDAGWHIYSQSQPVEAISEPTKIIFNKSPLLIITGKPKETGTKEKYEDKQSGIIQYQYSGKVNFVQTITLKAAVKTNVTGVITYQACSGEMCLPPKTIIFKLPL